MQPHHSNELQLFAISVAADIPRFATDARRLLNRLLTETETDL